MSGQNTSSAVMAQRVEARDSLDFFPTPPWATRALCEWLIGRGHQLHLQDVHEPACGAGDMARPLGEYFDTVSAHDVHDHGWAGIDRVHDFLLSPPLENLEGWIITNPPFRLAVDFIRLARVRAEYGVAMLVRTSFLEGAERYRALYESDRPTHVLQFCERVPMFRGRLNGKGSTATSYCWLVWERSKAGATVFDWIAPGARRRLEREGDYPPEPASDPAPTPLFGDDHGCDTDSRARRGR